MRLQARQDKRCLCTACQHTSSATHGTALSRLRTSAATVIRVVTVMAHGCPLQALGSACGFDERTVASWWARVGSPGQAVQAPLGEPPRDLGQAQADASRLKTPGGIVWMALALMVRPRLGLAGEISAQRDMPLIRRLSVRGRGGAAPRPLWWCTEGVCSSLRAMRETCRDPPWTGTRGRQPQ